MVVESDFSVKLWPRPSSTIVYSFTKQRVIPRWYGFIPQYDYDTIFWVTGL